MWSQETTAREDRWIGNKSKKDRFATANTISKRANANLGIKISKHTISRRLDEVNLNSQVASTKINISKMIGLKFATEHIIWTEEHHMDCGVVFISAMSQSLTCSAVTGKGSFDTVLRNNIHLSALKAEKIWRRKSDGVWHDSCFWYRTFCEATQ